MERLSNAQLSEWKDYELIFQDSKKIMLVKSDLRREGGMKNKKNRMLEHMCSCITPGHA